MLRQQQTGLEVEEYLVAALIFCEDRKLFNTVTGIVSCDWFISNECRVMFSFLKTATEDEINPNTMNASVGGHEAWNAEPFRIWLYRIANEYPVGRLGGSIVANAKLLAEQYRQRMFLKAAGDALTDAKRDPHEDYIGPLETALDRLKRISLDYKDDDFSNDVLDLVDAIESGVIENRGLETGISGLDARAGTMRPGQLIVVGARPSVGKSIFGAAITMHNARQGKTCYFASMEMEKAEVIQRLIANEAGCPVICGQRSQQVREAAIKVSNYNVHVDDRTTLSVTDIGHRVKEVGAVDLIVVDYLQLLKPADSQEIREQQVASDTRELKRLAGDVNAPVVLMSQLNRKATEGVPQLSHLRESGAIEQDANKVFLLDRELDEERLDIYIRKNRSGEQGLVETRFEGATARITDGGIQWSPS